MSNVLLEVDGLVWVLGDVHLVATLTDHLALAQVVHVQQPLPGLSLRLGHDLADFRVLLEWSESGTVTVSVLHYLQICSVKDLHIIGLPYLNFKKRGHSGEGGISVSVSFNSRINVLYIYCVHVYIEHL